MMITIPHISALHLHSFTNRMARALIVLLVALLIAITASMAAFVASFAAAPATPEQATPIVSTPVDSPFVRALSDDMPVSPAFAGNTERWGLFADAEIKVASQNLK